VARLPSARRTALSWLDDTSEWPAPPAGHFFEHRLALELDGGVHSQIDPMRRDALKEDYLRTLGIRRVRIANALVLEHPDEFVREVVEAVRAPVEKATRTNPLARGTVSVCVWFSKP
jgi:hypothetical protein